MHWWQFENKNNFWILSWLCDLLETFSIRFFLVNVKQETWGCHMTTVLQSHLQFAVHVWIAGRASGGKRFTARFFCHQKLYILLFKVRFLHLNQWILYVLQTIKVKHCDLTKNKMAALSNKCFAKIQNPDKVKLPTCNCKLQIKVCDFPRKTSLNEIKIAGGHWQNGNKT